MNKNEILKKVDHTVLAQTATWEQIKNICDDGIKYNVASVCIPPSYVKDTKKYVGDKLKVCTVIGFPNGYNTTNVKVYETLSAIEEGADEIDMVINLGWLKDKKYVDIDFSKCDYDKTNNVINHPNFPIELFTPGEFNVISVFRLRTNWDTYFDANGKAIPEKMTTLKKEIDLGIWDTYLFWDLESYQNMQNQSNMANVFAKVMLQNMGIQLNATASNEKFDEKK